MILLKIGIMPDLHLGVSKFRKMSGLQNAYSKVNNESFVEGMNVLNENEVDIIIKPGDIFDSPNPGVESIYLANSVMESIDIDKIVVGGNHDYSQRLMSMGHHAFSLLSDKRTETVYKDFKIFEFNDCDITVIPYKSINADTFGSVFKGKLKNKDKKSILVIHGYVDFLEESESEYALPVTIASNYDLVIAGHVHLRNLVETASTSILTTGALMPSDKAISETDRPAVYIYDTETGIIRTIILKSSPTVLNITTSDINKTLIEISNNISDNCIYSIVYRGKIQDVDEYLYKMALQNSLNLSLRSTEEISLKKIDKVSSFWSFIESEHPKYYEEFKLALKEGLEG